VFIYTFQLAVLFYAISVG